MNSDRRKFWRMIMLIRADLAVNKVVEMCVMEMNAKDELHEKWGQKTCVYLNPI